MCRKGDNEDLLLLCDGCDKGCHTYCHKPKITSIPEGDWYCPACISKVSLDGLHSLCTSSDALRLTVNIHMSTETDLFFDKIATSLY